MKKNDVILIGVILVLAAAGLLYMYSSQKTGDMVVITVDGKVYKELPLDKDTTVEIEGINGTNLLQIKNGYADIIEASCPDAVCVHSKAINHNEETIVCLPNKVIVKVQSNDNSGLDGIAN